MKDNCLWNEYPSTEQCSGFKADTGSIVSAQKNKGVNCEREFPLHGASSKLS